MNSSFKNKIVVITGAANGIGKTICKKFCEEGAFVTIIDIDKVSCDCLIKDLHNEGYGITAYIADVSLVENVKKIINEIIISNNRIDILINNAGITRRANVIDTTINEWNKVIGVNLTSFFLMCKYVIPHMKNEKYGVIVNTASGWGLVGGSKAVSYCASKGGVVLLTKAMAIDHGKDNIRVNCICPGDTDTNMLINEARQLGYDDNHLINSANDRPLGRIGSVDEIASAVLFLASDAASFITGEALVVDGGGLAGSA